MWNKATILPSLLILPLGMLLPGGTGHAQNVTLDQGTFVVYLDGRRAGLETFSIRRAGTAEDARVIATAEVRLEVSDGSLRMDPALEAAGQDLTVAAYQVKVSGVQQEEIAISSNAQRFVARIRSQRGEQVREYRATPTTLIVDEWVAHQYYFLHSRLSSGADRLQVIVPRSGRSLTLAVSGVSAETISIGGSEVRARHVRLEAGDESRHVWLDEDGRVLRVLHGEGDYRAERQEPPP